jgi:hypothetical protein
MTAAKPYGTTTIWPRPIHVNDVIQVQYSLSQPVWYRYNTSAEPCGTGTINPSANVEWPIWIGPFSSQVAHVVWNNSTEKCDHCLGPGLFRTHSPITQAHHLFGPGLSLIYSWTILLYVIVLVLGCLEHTPITQAYHLFCPGLYLIHPWAIFISVATAPLITAPDSSTSRAVGFLQSWKDAAIENYVAPTMCVCTLHTIIF